MDSGTALHRRLNERRYGALQGLNKARTAAKFPAARAGARLAPRLRHHHRPLDETDPRYEITDPALCRRAQAGRVSAYNASKDTVARVLPFWNDTIAPTIKVRRASSIAAHGNNIRALIKIPRQGVRTPTSSASTSPAQPLGSSELDARFGADPQLLPRRSGSHQGGHAGGRPEPEPQGKGLKHRKCRA